MPLPISDISNPDVIKFLIENYEKVAKLRMKWNNLHKEKLLQAATLQRPEKGYFETDVLKATIVGGLPTIIRDHEEAGHNRRKTPIKDAVTMPTTADLKKTHTIPQIGLGNVTDDPRLGRPDSDLTIDPKMRPIDSKDRKILYKPIPVYGREVYLKTRAKILPEDRYYMQEAENWGYGWRLKDTHFGKGSKRYGKVYVLTRDAQSRTGPQPDPYYYQKSNIAGVSKCYT